MPRLQVAPQLACCGPQARFFGDRTGVVKFFNPERGFGFIECEGKDYFVHYTGIESTGGFRSLGDGEDVEFDLEDDGKGKQRAVRVTGPDGAAVKGSHRNRSAGFLPLKSASENTADASGASSSEVFSLADFSGR